ncbi:MAG: hypothetical protein HYZ00_02145, partial [Candidatus Hydrogenedentes bacterium]|nr:hypothetical protein [Candidatus Hydrogenedentota bacterium]
SGVVQTGADGKALVSFTLPKFNGQVRLVALAVTPAATGAGDAYVYVRQPYMLRTSLPRFTLPGDHFQVHANVFNTTDAPVKLRLSWAASGTLSGSGSKEMPLAAKGEASTLADVTAGTAIGQGTVQWIAEILDTAGTLIEKVEESLPLPVLPPAVYQSDHELVVLPPGESRSFQNTRFLKELRVDMSLDVGANPLLRLKEPLKYLVGYPYGCVEQTTSRGLPLYLLRKNVALLGGDDTDSKRYEQYVKAAIRRLFTMQTNSGGLAMWPGGNEPYPYGSVYAGHFLTLVKRDQELELPEQPFHELQEYVRRVAKDSADDSFAALYLRAYALYVLALDGDAEALEQLHSFDNVLMPRAARYLIAAALAVNTQDAPLVQHYLASTPSELYEERYTSGILNSDTRNTAVRVMAQIQMGAPGAVIQEDVDKLLRYLEQRRYYTTQETAFVVTALGLYLEQLGGQPELASATIAGPDGEKTITGAGQFKAATTDPGAVFTVANTGQRSMFINFTAAGTPAQPDLSAVSEGVTISRSYISPERSPLSGLVFEHGKSYLATLTFSCIEDVENLIVADLLPAGFEIENPRLDPDVMEGLEPEGAVTPSYLEIRDDRLVLAFDSLGSGPHKFYYLVRAVTPGTFSQPPVQAECMYAPAIHGHSVPGSVNIGRTTP